MDLISECEITEDEDIRRYYQESGTKVTAAFDKNEERFGCGWCWARAQEVN